MGWREIEFSLEDTPSPPADGSDDSPPESSNRASSNLLDAADMHVYGPGGVGAGDQRLVSCNDCKKPILESALPNHLLTCERVRELAAQKARYTNGSTNDISEGKKRSLSDASGDESATTKKIKGEPKKKTSISVKPPNAAKQARAKGPIDVNTQCGVNIGDGKACARSLTCKSHSLSQKCDVPGRSAPFKVLLAEWQMRNNVDAKTKAQAAQVLREHAINKDKAPAMSSANAAQTALKKAKSRQMYYGEMSESDGSADEGFMGDSEDEVEQVFAGLNAAKNGCKPLAQPTFGGSLCVRAIKHSRFRDALFGS